MQLFFNSVTSNLKIIQKHWLKEAGWKNNLEITNKVVKVDIEFIVVKSKVLKYKWGENRKCNFRYA